MTPTPPFRLRPATPADASALARLHVTSWRETYPGLLPAEYLERMTGDVALRRREDNWREIISAGGLLTGERVTILVAEQGGELVAFASGGTPRDHPGADAELMTLYCLIRIPSNSFTSGTPPEVNPFPGTRSFSFSHPLGLNHSVNDWVGVRMKRAQGRGIGRALLRTLARELHASGARNLALWVLDVNPTREWYLRQGGREDGAKTVPIPGGELREVRLVWDDLRRLR